MKKIGVTGAQNTGKTTFIRDIAKEIESQGQKAIILDEVARSCPLPINEACYLSSQLWIALTQITREIETCFSEKSDGAVLLTDRTILDNYAYALGFELRKRRHFGGTQIMKDIMGYWSKTYDLVFYLKPLPASMVDDGVRSTDQGWQKEIDRIIHSTIQHYRLNSSVVHTIHTTNRQERVEQAMLHLTPLLQQKNKKLGEDDHMVQKQIPMQEALL